jgi:hypothetical protein
MSVKKSSDQENGDPKKKDSKPDVPDVPHVKIDEPLFKDFIQGVSFVASIGVALALISSQTLACASSFMGRNDSTTMASVQYSAVIFTWSACMYGIGLMLSLATQLLITSDTIQNMINGDHRKGYRDKAQYFLGFKCWVSLGFTLAATVLVGEGLKIVIGTAGSILQWSLLFIVIVSLPLPIIAYITPCIKSEYQKHVLAKKSQVAPAPK